MRLSPAINRFRPLLAIALLLWMAGASLAPICSMQTAACCCETTGSCAPSGGCEPGIRGGACNMGETIQPAGLTAVTVDVHTIASCAPVVSWAIPPECIHGVEVVPMPVPPAPPPRSSSTALLI